MNESGANNVTYLTAPSELVEDFSALKQRAEAMRRTADTLNDVLAHAYRRRASELEFQLWLSQLRAGLEVDPIAA